MIFYFNNISSEDLGLMVTKSVIPPASATQHDIISIPNRESPIFKAKTQRKEITITIQTTIVEENKIREIYKALQGKGILVLSTEPDKYYTATVQELVPEHIALYMGTLPISFICDPFAYSVNDQLTEYGTTADIENSGTYYSEPLIKVYGTGDLTLTLNGEVWNLSNIDEYITIDSQRKLVYKDNTIMLSKISRADGRIVFPCFNTGVNRISTTGTKLEVKKNERWL